MSLKAEEELFTSLIYRRKIIIEKRQTDSSKNVIVSWIFWVTFPKLSSMLCWQHRYLHNFFSFGFIFTLTGCLWFWFLSVCPLMPLLSAYHLTWVSLTLDVGYLFMVAPAKHSHSSLPWKWPPLLTLDVG